MLYNYHVAMLLHELKNDVQQNPRRRFDEHWIKSEYTEGIRIIVRQIVLVVSH